MTERLSADEWKARIAKAAGARQTREDEALARRMDPTKQRRRRQPGERLACGCLPEEQEQIEFIRQSRALGLVFAWVKNEGPLRGDAKRRARLNAWARARGLLSGVPDLVCLSYPGLWVEMKSECSEHQCSDSQLRVHSYLRRNGGTVIVGHGCADAMKQLGAWRAAGGWFGYHKDLTPEPRG